MADAKPSEGLRIRIRLKAYDHKVIDQSAKQIIDTAIRTGAGIAGPVPLPTRRSSYTVVKSPHVYKTGGETFEMRVHKRLIDIINPNQATIEALTTLDLPAGVEGGALELLSIASHTERPIAFHPRHLIRLGEGASLTLVETSLGPDGAAAPVAQRAGGVRRGGRGRGRVPAPRRCRWDG